jgi:N-acetylglucosaminyldiphosphoundecaprenol N-acetyl-beta-D-mannosaminyltransferase
LEKRCPGLRVTGWRHGYFTAEEESVILEEINTLSPDILLVGMGMPRQELWANRHRRILNTRVIMCVGGALDIMSGKLTLTPDWIRRVGFEWLHRLIREPSRLKRMMDLPRFMFAIIKQRCTNVTKR